MTGQQLPRQLFIHLLPATQPVTCNSLGTRPGLVRGTGDDGQLQVPPVQAAAGPPCPSQPDGAAATVHG